ncbi:MAG: hypothetical protein K1X94_36475 [Sandaracinaceae bacterium]|nr:hypothetical protein [Sandaracinaceae bacterium]
MPSTPRVVYATRNSKQPTPVHVRPSILPIVLVPGIMGTRLTDPRTDDLVWNPSGEPFGDSPGPFTVDVERLQQVSAPLVPDETHREALRSKHREVQHIRHWYNLVQKHYGALAKHLAALDLPALEERHLTPRVYCCGYDWRQDNARSAARLAGVVEEALRETGASKVIVVAHGMGGLVARYYCHALGGESKVHQLVLLASPTLGSPAAYAQLRQGAYGLYGNDLADQIEASSPAAAEECVETASQLIAGAAMAGAQGPSEALGVFGELYLALCLGAGRALSRAETRHFLRQLPSLYQLMPNATFCNAFRDWLVFDPAATGHRPTGFMIQLPSTEDLTAAITRQRAPSFATGSDLASAQHAEALNAARAAGESAEVSGRASRNVATLPALTERVRAHLVAGEVGEAVALLYELAEQCERAFIDARSSRALYEDIYTGLLDVVSLRALSAGHLLSARAFDAALSVDAREVEPFSPIEPFRAAFAAAGVELGDALAGPSAAVDRREMRNLAAAAEASRPMRVYMHPCTANLYGDGLPCDGGAVLIPQRAVSRDDSNLVKVLYLPKVLATGGPLAVGDGSVPSRSANPSAAHLSRSFERAVAIANVTHTALPSHAQTLTAIDAAISENIAAFPLGARRS